MTTAAVASLNPFNSIVTPSKGMHGINSIASSPKEIGGNFIKRTEIIKEDEE